MRKKWLAVYAFAVFTGLWFGGFPGALAVIAAGLAFAGDKLDDIIEDLDELRARLADAGKPRDGDP